MRTARARNEDTMAKSTRARRLQVTRRQAVYFGLGVAVSLGVLLLLTLSKALARPAILPLAEAVTTIPTGLCVREATP